jgi:hypothetical protein
MLARFVWVDEAPAILKQDAEDFLRWCEARHQPNLEPRPAASPAPAPPSGQEK